MDKQPNILLLLTDEQRFDTIAAAGFPWMITPNLDRLAKEGCLFSHGHTPNPVCVPARHSLLTGVSCRDHGFFTNGGKSLKDDALPTLPRMLAENGYFTAAVGKMHFKPVREHHGFAEMHLMEEVPRHRADDQYVQYLAEQGHGDVRAIHGIRPYVWHAPQFSTVPDAHHGSKWVADRTIEVIERNKDRPFFVQCGFIAPHPPFNVPHGLKGMYKDQPIPPSIRPHRQDPHYSAETAWAGDMDSTEERRAVQEAYLTMISHVDQQVGRLIDYLDSIGELDNTFIIYTSDHGEMLGDHGYWGKMLPHDASVRVPFVCRYPKAFAPGTVDDRFVDLCDILPTFMDVACISFKEKHQPHTHRLMGDSFLKPSSEKRDFNYQWCEFGKLEQYRWVMLRDRRYKYVYYHHGGFEYFYDMQADPQELCNLAGSDALPEVDFDRLKAQCLKMESSWGPEGAVVDGDFVVLTHNAPTDPMRNTNKFVGCGFTQLPRFGTDSPEEEARHLADDFKRAMVEMADHDLQQYAPGSAWFDKWHETFIAYGGTEALWEEMMRLTSAEA